MNQLYRTWIIISIANKIIICTFINKKILLSMIDVNDVHWVSGMSPDCYVSMTRNCYRLLWVATCCYSVRSRAATLLEEACTTNRYTIQGHRWFREQFFPELNIRKINLCTSNIEEKLFNILYTKLYYENSEMNTIEMILNACMIWNKFLKLKIS